MEQFKRNYISALAIVLALSLFVLLFLLSRKEIFTKEDASIIGSFIEWFGVLYGVLLALVVVEVWQRYSLLNNEIDREADALVLLLKTIRFLDDENKIKQIAGRIVDYCNIILQFKNTYAFESSGASNKLDDIHNAVGEMLKSKKIPIAFSMQILHNINDAIDIRGDWVAHTKDRMPKTLRFLIFFTSIVWILGFFGLNIKSDVLALMLCGAATFTVSTILFIITDLDDPKGGVWTAQFDSFEVLKEEAEKILELKNEISD